MSCQCEACFSCISSADCGSVHAISERHNWKWRMTDWSARRISKGYPLPHDGRCLDAQPLKLAIGRVLVVVVSYVASREFAVYRTVSQCIYIMLACACLILTKTLWLLVAFPLCLLLKQFRSLTLYNTKAIIVPHRIIRSWYTGRWWVGCYIWYSEEGTGVTALPLTASLPITVFMYNGPLLCAYNVPIKELSDVFIFPL